MELDEYNQKRNFKVTNEPQGIKRKERKKKCFVVQHHLAKKDHYDLRLEWKGTLKSFAIPKGPSFVKNERRLAIMVEDHPLAYKNFEGVIKKGEYGAGIVMIFDEGYWEELSEVDKNFNNKVLKFRLYGRRLKGNWSLVHFKDNNYLLIKEEDEFAFYTPLKDFDISIKSGLSMYQIKQGKLNVTFTNLDKLIMGKVTKGDLLNYYQKVGARMLEYAKSRLISTVRAPKGIKGKVFFKKHFENNKALGKLMVNKKDYYYLKNMESIIREVQMNGYEFHMMASKVNKLNHPDMLVFDLDPGLNVSLEMLRQGVRDLKKILDELNLVSFLKTSGKKGYHVVVPIHSLKSWKSFERFAHNVALLMEKKWPMKYVSSNKISKRTNKIFIDWLRNTKGASSVCPYSVRLNEKASVSMPIFWWELDKVKPDEITIDKAIKRLKRKDPWFDFFSIDQ